MCLWILAQLFSSERRGVIRPVPVSLVKGLDGKSLASREAVPSCRPSSSRPTERTAEEIEIIYEELLHIKALSHLSYMVKRELASVLVFESHAKAGTVRKS